MEPLNRSNNTLVDVVVLTDHRYVAPEQTNDYINNVLHEDAIVVKALKQRGLRVERRSWDDDQFKWENAGVLLFRTTWDYFDRFAEFAPWLKKVSESCILVNPPEVLHWNIDKHYLNDLKSGGINIPPTVIIEKVDACDLKALLKDKKWSEAVVKPCVSGAGRHTYKISESHTESTQQVMDELLTREAMMVQEFQRNIVDRGELSLMIIDGIYTHAVLKKAREGEFRVQDDFGGSVHPYEPTNEEIRFAKDCVKASGFDLAYARVDIFRDNKGQLCLAELELIEPELWFRFHPEAAEVLAAGITRKYFSEG
ncbi:ATP-grasp domain-containing protein [Robertkochia sediminum]|uniref:ATP-grasp domain-containing protein n=1 Tax=Robertkochia sediminum TaxID=2785326 RepID=UPI0019320E44|nr:hypothetical protein [Robertkochia sediminum]MBL7473491.1 hypothetical protein [Robertkochia sediminum]